jgi:hypothetical protein
MLGFSGTSQTSVEQSMWTEIARGNELEKSLAALVWRGKLKPVTNVTNRPITSTTSTLWRCSFRGQKEIETCDSRDGHVHR